MTRNPIEYALKIAKRSRPNVSGMEMPELEKAVQDICDMLRGPGVDQMERIVLNEERKVLRAEIAGRLALNPRGDGGE